MMNQKFPSLLKTLKTKYSKINKDVFIEMVKNQRTDSETDSIPGLEDLVFNVLSREGNF